MTSEDWNLSEIVFGIALISPLDEALAAMLSSGASVPAAPLQATISGIIGVGLVLHGATVLK